MIRLEHARLGVQHRQSDLARFPCNSPCTPVGATQDNLPTELQNPSCTACKTDSFHLPQPDSPLTQTGHVRSNQLTARANEGALGFNDGLDDRGIIRLMSLRRVIVLRRRPLGGLPPGGSDPDPRPRRRPVGRLSLPDSFCFSFSFWHNRRQLIPFLNRLPAGEAILSVRSAFAADVVRQRCGRAV